MVPDRASARAMVLMGTQVGAAGAGALATLALAALLPSADFGRAMEAISAAMLLSILFSLNLDACAMRVLTQGDAAARARFSGAATRVIWLGAVLALPVVVIRAGAPVAAVITALALSLALVRLGARQGTALGRPLGTVIPRLMSRPLGLGGAVLVLWSGVGASWWLPALTLALATGLAAMVQARSLRPVRPPASGGWPASHWLRNAACLVPGLLFLEFFRDMAIVSAGLALDDAALGRFALALTLIALPGFAIVAVEIATGRPIAAAIAAGQPVNPRLVEAARLRLAGAVGCLGALALALPLASAWLPADDLSPLLWPLATVPAIRALIGNPMAMLNLYQRDATVLRICGAGVPLTAAAIALSSAGFGAAGAAWAAAAGFGLTQAALWQACRRQTPVDPSVRVLWRRRPTAPVHGHRSPDPAPSGRAAAPAAPG
ncbi:MAG: hypothetical protein AAGE76_01960 [Pseudomonadota bacterium]